MLGGYNYKGDWRWNHPTPPKDIYSPFIARVCPHCGYEGFPHYSRIYLCLQLLSAAVFFPAIYYLPWFFGYAKFWAIFGYLYFFYELTLSRNAYSCGRCRGIIW
ncbi:MAG: hypothetical protein ACXVB9_09100 [Bdellovibrionota bacterium]